MRTIKFSNTIRHINNLKITTRKGNKLYYFQNISKIYSIPYKYRKIFEVHIIINNLF